MRQTERGVAKGDRRTDAGKETQKKKQSQAEGRVRGRKQKQKEAGMCGDEGSYKLLSAWRLGFFLKVSIPAQSHPLVQALLISVPNFWTT